METGDQLSKVVVVNPQAHLPVEDVDGRLPQRIAVNLLDDWSEALRRTQQGVRVLLQAFVGPEARAGGPAQLSATARPLLRHGEVDRGLDRVVMPWRARQRGLLRI